MHHLWFSTGGSAGHSSLVGLDVFEGVYEPGGKPRVWEVNVLNASEVIGAEEERCQQARDDEADQRRQARLERDLNKVALVFEQHRDGETRSGVAEHCKLSRKRAREAIDVMLDEAMLEQCQVAKGRGSRMCEGYRLVNSNA